MVVGIARVRIMVSALERKAVVRRVKDKVLARFAVAVADVGDPESDEVVQLGVAVVGHDRGTIDSLLDKVMGIVEAEAKVVNDEREVMHFGDTLAGGGEPAHWEPEEPSPPGFGQPAPAPDPAVPAVVPPLPDPAVPEPILLPPERMTIPVAAFGRLPRPEASTPT